MARFYITLAYVLLQIQLHICTHLCAHFKNQSRVYQQPGTKRLVASPSIHFLNLVGSSKAFPTSNHIIPALSHINHNF